MISFSTTPFGPCRRTFVVAALALAGPLLHSGAQEATPAPEGAPPAILDESLPMADPAFLAPVEALTGDEKAFLEMMWSTGNDEIERIETMQAELRQPMPEDVAKLKQTEIRKGLANLKALCALALQHFDQNAQVHNFHGTVLYDVFGEQLEAVKEWHTAESLDSNYGDPHNNLGMHYFHAGNYRLGFHHMDRALELEPKSPDFCFNMAQNYLIYRPQTEQIRGWDNEKIYKEAMKLSKKATKLAPGDFELLQDYAVNFLAAENFGLEPDWKEAAKAWQAARKHARTETETFFTWLNEGRAWRALDNKKEARRCFEAALVLMPGNEITERLLGEMKAAS